MEKQALREHFAIHAPANCGHFLLDWEYAEPKPQPPVGYHYHKAGGSAGVDEAAEAEESYRQEHSAWQARQRIAFEVAARWAFADAMVLWLESHA